MPRIDTQKIKENLEILEKRSTPFVTDILDEVHKPRVMAFDLVQMRLLETVERELYRIEAGAIVWVDRNRISKLAKDPRADIATNRLMYPRHRVSLTILEEYDEFDNSSVNAEDGECVILPASD